MESRLDDLSETPDRNLDAIENRGTSSVDEIGSIGKAKLARQLSSINAEPNSNTLAVEGEQIKANEDIILDEQPRQNERITSMDLFLSEWSMHFVDLGKDKEEAGKVHHKKRERTRNQDQPKKGRNKDPLRKHMQNDNKSDDLRGIGSLFRSHPFGGYKC
ncbi:MAG: hypothetical protein M1834_002526 [Cirrosporium novae-zelandiae]|nr:MAG: hypothetical protein M1834_002526 [Cirrosporium novae-zelandiae]